MTILIESGMVSLSVIGILIALVATGTADPLVRVRFSGEDQSVKFQQFADEKNLDIWRIDEKSANVRVPESMDLLKEIHAKYPTEIIYSDVLKLAESSMAENEMAELFAKRFRSSDSINTFFHKYEQIEQWLKDLQKSNDYVQVRSVGTSYESRNMYVLRIAADGSAEGKKPAIFLTGGIHAREWLSTATVNYIINQVLKDRNSGERRVTNLLKTFDFYFMPVTNPDGYAYTFKSSNARMWRKTRRPSGRGCIGSDPNRNFDVSFGERGASRNPCSDTYPGPYAFSEDVTQHLRDFGNSLSGRLKLYYDVHAYSQMYFVPFAYNSRVKPQNDAELRRVGQLSRDAIQKVNRRTYSFGPPGSILYDASGSTMDWFLLHAAKYSYALELYPDGNAPNGFIVPTSAIVPSGKEVFAGVLTAAENIEI